MFYILTSSSCIKLACHTAGWFFHKDKYQSGQSQSCNSTTCRTHLITNYSTNVAWINGSWPVVAKRSNDTPPTQPRWAPRCWGHFEGEAWPWTGCQAAQVNWTNEDKLFTFSPDMVGKNKGLLNIPVFVLPAYSLKIIYVLLICLNFPVIF